MRINIIFSFSFALVIHDHIIITDIHNLVDIDHWTVIEMSCYIFSIEKTYKEIYKYEIFTFDFFSEIHCTYIATFFTYYLLLSSLSQIYVEMMAISSWVTVIKPCQLVNLSRKHKFIA